MSADRCASKVKYEPLLVDEDIVIVEDNFHPVAMSAVGRVL